MSFARTANLGKQGEILVSNTLAKGGYEVVSNTDKEKKYDYDLIATVGKTKITIEVKYDAMAAKTGNLAIEYTNDRKDSPSGISVTKAKLWAHVVLDNGLPTVWIASVKKLKNFVDNTKPLKTISNGGDGNAGLYIYRDNVILSSVFTRIDNIPVDSIQKTINSILKAK